MSAFNNNNDNLNNTSAGQANRVSRPTDNQLNENHGIAATGLNDPILGGSVAGQQQGLNYSGAPIPDTQKVNQQENYGHTAGHDLNSNTNRTGGTGIPPVNTAAHAQQNAAQEALGSGHNTHHAGTSTGQAAATSADAAKQAAATATGATGLTGRNVDPVSTGQHDTLTSTGHRHDPTNVGHHTSTTGHHNTATGHHDPTSTTGHHTSATGATTGAHGATTGAHGAPTGAHGAPTGASTGAHGATGAHSNDPVSYGATHGTHPTGAGLGTGLPGKDQKHVGDQRFNDKHGNFDHHNEDLNAAEKKPTAGEKIKGNLEKMTGKITGNEAKVIEGENLAQGRKL